jgi:hypothetical protein
LQYAVFVRGPDLFGIYSHWQGEGSAESKITELSAHYFFIILLLLFLFF